MKPAPSKIKQEDRPPNKKYFNPADTEEWLSLFKVVRTYKANDCNSIHRYIEIKSTEQIRREDPKILNKAIKEYSDEKYVL